MITFGDFLEGLHTFSSRDPDYDLALAGDYSDDKNDISYFLLPFMKKIKAFYWWCEMVVHETDYDDDDEATFRFSPRISRNQRANRVDNRYAARTMALSLLAGQNDRLIGESLSSYVRYILDFLRDIYNCSFSIIKGSPSFTFLIKRCQETCKDIEAAIKVVDHDNFYEEKVEKNLLRIDNFIKKSIPQLERMRNLHNPGTHKPTDLIGRRV